MSSWCFAFRAFQTVGTFLQPSNSSNNPFLEIFVAFFLHFSISLFLIVIEAIASRYSESTRWRRKSGRSLRGCEAGNRRELECHARTIRTIEDLLQVSLKSAVEILGYVLLFLFYYSASWLRSIERNPKYQQLKQKMTLCTNWTGFRITTKTDFSLSTSQKLILVTPVFFYSK